MADNTGRFRKGQIPWNKGIKSCNGGGAPKGTPAWNKGQGVHSPICKCGGRKAHVSILCFKCHNGAKVVWNKGKHLTKEHREKLRQAKLGIRGELHWNWRPWTEDSHRDRVYFRDTMQKKIFARDNYSCVLCSSIKDLQVDHIKRWANYPELRFEESNCRTLCAPCHYKITFGNDMPEHVKAWGHNLPRRIA